MPTFISLLRGINVSGQKSIKMADLRKLYESMGFENVLTYIQSGNVIFDTPEDSAGALSPGIAVEIKKIFGYEVQVLVKTPSEFSQVIQNMPFDQDRAYLTFLFELPDRSAMDEVEKSRHESEQVELRNDIVYLRCPSGYGRSKLSNNFMEKIFRGPATTRNWNTVSRLLAMAEEHNPPGPHKS